MFCKNCGNEIADAAVVCPKCGVPVAGKSVASATEQVPNHMVGAILTALFCCQIGGIVAIVYAAQVNSKLARGDIEGARAASKTANTWITVNIITGVLIGVIYAIIGAASAM
jgi:uncharacterized membrane protein YvbJ